MERWKNRFFLSICVLRWHREDGVMTSKKKKGKKKERKKKLQQLRLKFFTPLPLSPPPLPQFSLYFNTTKRSYQRAILFYFYLSSSSAIFYFISLIFPLVFFFLLQQIFVKKSMEKIFIFSDNCFFFSDSFCFLFIPFPPPFFSLSFTCELVLKFLQTTEIPQQE